jgi:hypothetical protein
MDVESRMRPHSGYLSFFVCPRASTPVTWAIAVAASESYEIRLTLKSGALAFSEPSQTAAFSSKHAVTEKFM